MTNIDIVTILAVKKSKDGQPYLLGERAGQSYRRKLSNRQAGNFAKLLKTFGSGECTMEMDSKWKRDL